MNAHVPTIFAGAPAKEIRARHPLARVALIRAREDRGLSRPDLAKKISLSRTSIFRIEMGKGSTTVAKMTRWADALGPGVTLDLFRPVQD
jgi:transcriptional regulator with XRE-family HTH domain